MEKLLGKLIRDSWKNTSDVSAAFSFLNDRSKCIGRILLVILQQHCWWKSFVTWHPNKKVAEPERKKIGKRREKALKTIGLTWVCFTSYPKKKRQEVIRSLRWHITQPGYHFLEVAAFLESYLVTSDSSSSTLKNSNSNVLFLDGKKLRKSLGLQLLLVKVVSNNSIGTRLKVFFI